MAQVLIHNVDVVGTGLGWVLTDGAVITAVGAGHPDIAALNLTPDAEVTDGRRALLMPGAIDCHVHMREPGLTQKADIASETRAALVGGVTAIIDMPNTVPQTTSAEALRDKLSLLRCNSVVSYAAFPGATATNADFLRTVDRSTVPGVKLFLGSSTGGMLVDNPGALNQIFAICAERDMPVCVHAEDEAVIAACRQAVKEEYAGQPIPIFEHSRIRPVKACVRATEHALQLARRHGTHVHIAHLTTAAEVDLIREARAEGVRVTCEVSPHHLMFCADDYARLGARIKMNPAVKTAADRDALRAAAADGTIDMVATDHAPHCPADKEGDALTAASGAPIVQFALPALLDIFEPTTVARLYCAGPARVYAIHGRGHIAPGNAADLVLVGRADNAITDADVVSKCGWTPLTGHTLHHTILKVWHTAPVPLTFG